MFAWCDLTMKSNPKETAADAFAKKYNILALAGSTFGNVNGDADKFRINIACSKEDFTELISRIQNVK
jgi:bifunctional pyridoxal-dependent enzyme with beta-cystathionase and maltose regulon repressor activities